MIFLRICSGSWCRPPRPRPLRLPGGRDALEEHPVGVGGGLVGEVGADTQVEAGGRHGPHHSHHVLHQSQMGQTAAAGKLRLRGINFISSRFSSSFELQFCDMSSANQSSREKSGNSTKIYSCKYRFYLSFFLCRNV